MSNIIQSSLDNRTVKILREMQRDTEKKIPFST